MNSLESVDLYVHAYTLHEWQDMKSGLLLFWVYTINDMGDVYAIIYRAVLVSAKSTTTNQSCKSTETCGSTS